MPDHESGHNSPNCIAIVPDHSGHNSPNFIAFRITEPDGQLLTVVAALDPEIRPPRVWGRVAREHRDHDAHENRAPVSSTDRHSFALSLTCRRNR